MALVCILLTLDLTHLPIASLIIGVEKCLSYPRIEESRGIPLKLSKNTKNWYFSGKKTRFGEIIWNVDLTALVVVVQRWFLYRWNDLKKQNTTPLPNLDISRSKTIFGSQYLGQESKWSVVLITRSTVFLVNYVFVGVGLACFLYCPILNGTHFIMALFQKAASSSYSLTEDYDIHRPWIVFSQP